MRKRKSNSERLKALCEEMKKGKKAAPKKEKKAEKKAEKVIDADVNDDGKVDEKDVAIVEKIARKAKKVVKKEE